MLCLRKANMGDVLKEWRFVRDMPEDENGLTNDWHGVSLEDFAARALPEMLDASRGIGLREGYVPETFCFLWKDDEIVGQFRIRHFLSDALREGAGHIGYFIAKAHRNLGYGTEGLRLTLELARRIVPEEEFYLRVNRDNPASLRVMLKNGGRIVGENGEKYFVRIPNPGSGSDVSVRFARRDDLEAVNALRRQVNALHVAGRPETFKPDFGAELRDHVFTIFDDPRQKIVVAEKDGAVRGFAVLNHITRPENPYMYERDYLDVDEFGVDEACRRQGVATAMLRFIREYAQGEGFDRIELNMWEFNQGALAFYEAAGFKTYRRYMELRF